MLSVSGGTAESPESPTRGKPAVLRSPVLSFSFMGHLDTVQGAEGGHFKLDSTCFAGSPAPSANDIPLSCYYRLLSTGPRPLLEGPSSEIIASVWSPPHTHPLSHHGLHLCLPVFPLRPVLWECLVGCPRVHPTLSGANGEDDKIQDFPGLSALLPPDLQLHSLQSPLGQS